MNTTKGGKKKRETYQFLLFGHVFPGFHLGFMHSMKLSKVTFFKILNQ